MVPRFLFLTKIIAVYQISERIPKVSTNLGIIQKHKNGMVEALNVPQFLRLGMNSGIKVNINFWPDVRTCLNGLVSKIRLLEVHVRWLHS